MNPPRITPPRIALVAAILVGLIVTAFIVQRHHSAASASSSTAGASPASRISAATGAQVGNLPSANASKAATMPAGSPGSVLPAAGSTAANPPAPSVPEAVYLPTFPGEKPTPNQLMLMGADEVSRTEPVQNADGSFTRVRVVHTNDFKWPLLRVEETFKPDSNGRLDAHASLSLMVADHVLVQPTHKLSPEEANTLAASVGGNVRQQMRTSSNILIGLSASDPDALPKAIAVLAQHPLAKTAEPDHIVQALGTTPNDPSYGQLYGLHNTGQTIQGVVGKAGADIKAPEAWDFTTGSRSVLVAVVDTGVDLAHPDLVDQIATNPGEIPGNGIDDDGNGFVDDVHGWDFASNDNDPMDENNHGSHCSGTIGGTGNDGKGIVGVNWKVSILPCRFLNANGSGTDADAIESINYSVLRGAKISSNSWGSPDGSAAEKAAFAAAGVAGQVAVCAAGNNGNDANNYPAAFANNTDCANILSVAATDNNDNLATFSTYGPTVAVAAPGVNIYSSIVHAPYYAYFSGTSMATPHAAGVAALLLSAKPSLTNLQVIDCIKNSVDVLPGLNGKVTTSGRINAYKAIRNNLVNPWLNVVGTALADNGNANGIANPGETVTINSTFRNVAQQTATGVVATLSLAAADPYVTITNATANLGNFTSLQERVGTFAVTIAPNTPTPYTVTLNVTTVDSATPTPNTQTFPISFIVYTQSPVTGTVRAVDGTPIAGATVSYAGVFKGSTQTAADGTYSLSLVDGSPEISVTKTAYAPSDVRVVTLPPGKSGIDFVLGKAELAIGANALTATVRSDSRVVLDLPLSNSGTIPSAFKVAEMQYGYDKQTIGVSGYTWYDITTTGTNGTYVNNKVLGFNEYSNNNSGPYPIGMDFPFYENKFRSFRIHNNGWMSFTNSSRSIFNFMTDLPNPERPENMIAFAWAFNFQWNYKDPIYATYYPGDSRSMYYQQVDPQTFVITQKKWSLLEGDMLTSQVVLKRDGTILLQYGKYEATVATNYVTHFNGPATYCGGIQDGQSRRGLTAVYGMGNGVVDPVEGAVARIRPVVGAPWLSTNVAAGSIPPNGGQGSLKVTLDATGLAAGNYTTSLVLESDATGQPKVSIPVTLTVTASDAGLQWVAPAIGTTLTPGGSTTLDVQVLGSVASVTGVQFYNGSTLLGAGVLTGGTHYTFNWTGIPAGAYDLSAVATLSDGRTVWTPVQPANVGTGIRVSIDALDYSTETPATSRNRALIETYGRPRLDFNTLTLTPYARTASITRNGTVAKITMPAGHLLQKFAFWTAAAPKDTVKISGATQTQYNGLKTVTMVSYASDNSTTSDDYTFTVTGNPITPATGNIDAEDTGNAVVLDGGKTLGLGGEISRKIAFPYTITANTVLEFDFLGNAALDFDNNVIGIGFDNDNVLTNSKSRIFQIWGGKTDWGSNITYRTYRENTIDFTKSRWRHYRIPVGKHYTGAMSYLTFIQTGSEWYYRNDIDVAYRNVTAYEEPSSAIAQSNYTFTWSFNDSADTPQGEEIYRTYFEPGSKTISVNAFLGAKTASASRTVEITGTGGFSGKIKFQPASVAVFSGEIPDTGEAYGDRGNGYTYGWSTGGTPTANNTAIYSLTSYDQLKCSSIGQSATQTWEVAVPNGLYQVYLYAGSGTIKSSNHIKIEGLALIDKDSAARDYIDSSKKVLVTDGKLTLTNVPVTSWATTGALSYIEFSQLSGAAPHPYAAFTATQLTALPPFVVGFDGSASFSNSGNIVSYDWDFGDGTTGTGQLTSHTYATPGFRMVTLTVTDDAGETGIFSTAIRATDWTPVQAWRVSKFNTPYNTGNASNSADPDGDGMTNLMEYALNGNPLLQDPSALVTTSLDLTGHLVLSATRNPAATDVTLTVEVGDNLSLWQSGPDQTTTLTNTPSLLEVKDNTAVSSPGQKRFIRLKVTQP